MVARIAESMTTTPDSSRGAVSMEAASDATALHAAGEVRVSDYPTPSALLNQEELIWDKSNPPGDNYGKLGKLGRRFAAAGDLYRCPG